MKLPLWIRERIQSDPGSPLSGQEIIGLVFAFLYLLLACRVALDIGLPLFMPSHKDDELHKKCVLISSEIAKGSDASYRATYDLCIKGSLGAK